MTIKNSPDLKRSLSKRLANISGSYNSLDKNMISKKKDLKKHIQPFYVNESNNINKKKGSVTEFLVSRK